MADKCKHCGASVIETAKFCSECGAKIERELKCANCGTLLAENAKFCMECGKKKPAGAPIYRCDKCGWQPENPHNPPKFCMECGDPFTDDDIQ